jgi:hypothetical protein
MASRSSAATAFALRTAVKESRSLAESRVPVLHGQRHTGAGHGPERYPRAFGRLRDEPFARRSGGASGRPGRSRCALGSAPAHGRRCPEVHCPQRIRLRERRGRDLNPRRPQRPETVFEPCAVAAQEACSSQFGRRYVSRGPVFAPVRCTKEKLQTNSRRVVRSRSSSVAAAAASRAATSCSGGSSASSRESAGRAAKA